MEDDFVSALHGSGRSRLEESSVNVSYQSFLQDDVDRMARYTCQNKNNRASGVGVFASGVGFFLHQR